MNDYEFAEKLMLERSPEELCGQLLCYDVREHLSYEALECDFRLAKPGALFFSEGVSPEFIKTCTELANQYSCLPVIVAQDVENGPGCVFRDLPAFPDPMAWGACDDPELIEQGGEVTAQLCRLRGVHWSFSPVVDINQNPNNPIVNIRCPSDDAKQVAKIAGAYSRGLQKNGYLMACAKHFPGDGTDDRNQHFCTTINRKSWKDWQSTFGVVYREMMRDGIASVMVGHIALPCYDEEENDPFFGPLPAVLSKSLISGLLKGTLGFDGCVVSDAMSMIGAVSRASLTELAVRFLCAGGDMVLFPGKNDFRYVTQAYRSGKISKDRMEDALRRIIGLKRRARLFEDQEALLKQIKVSLNADRIAQEIAEKSIKIVRNFAGVLPLNKPRNALVINLLRPFFDPPEEDHTLEPFVQELQKRGIQTRVLLNPNHYLIHEIMDQYDCVLINCKMSSKDYHGGSLRIGWDTIMTFWRGYVLQHKNLVFTSFGDPYKLYELPFLKTYINAFSAEKVSQQAVVQLILGEIQEKAKNPVSLKGFFEREV